MNCTVKIVYNYECACGTMASLALAHAYYIDICQVMFQLFGSMSWLSSLVSCVIGCDSICTYVMMIIMYVVGPPLIINNVSSIFFLFAGEPKITRITSCLNDVTVYWNSVNSLSCGGVLYYNVTLYSNFRHLKTYTTTELFYTFTGLQDGESYSVTVVSITRAGSGLISQHMLVETLKPKCW